MLSCKDITETADAYIDDELSFRQRLMVSLHIFMCIHCRRYIRQLASTVATLRKKYSPEPCSDEEADQILDRILEQEDQ